jgi:hypothetical protein
MINGYCSIDVSYGYRMRRLILMREFSRSHMSLKYIDTNYEWVYNFYNFLACTYKVSDSPRRINIIIAYSDVILV